MRTLVGTFALILAAGTAAAAVKTKEIPYEHDGAVGCE